MINPPAIYEENKPVYLSNTEKAAEAVFWMALAADWLQTRDIVKNHGPKTYAAYSYYKDIYTVYEPQRTVDGLHETNLILGRRPTLLKVDIYFLLSGIIHYQVLKRIPTEYRTAFQTVSIGVELYCIDRNLKLGLKISWR